MDVFGLTWTRTIGSLNSSVGMAEHGVASLVDHGSEKMVRVDFTQRPHAYAPPLIFLIPPVTYILYAPDVQVAHIYVDLSYIRHCR